MNSRQIKLTKSQNGFCITFNAMASPCEVIIQTDNGTIAQQLGEILSKEVWRIEDKYSRYNPNSVCSVINRSAGQFTLIDEETYLLMIFADHCYQLSDGLFDITSGVLRKLWTFDGQEQPNSYHPSKNTVNKLIAAIGWHKVNFNSHQVKLDKNMELDFGGLGKEYAVDRCIILANEFTDEPVLVNLGGDLAVTCSRKYDEPWKVAIESPDSDLKKTANADMIISINSGALATSGDAKKFFIKEGVRYGHVLNPKTGMPVFDAPRSITVVAPQCIQAGVLSTLALLQGTEAESFLATQEVKFWARR